MDYLLRPAVRREWYCLLLNRFDELCIQDRARYSITFCTILSYHSIFCTFFSTLIIFVNAASNPCHGYFSMQSFSFRNIISVLLPVSGFLSSWSILSVLNDQQPKSKSSQRNPLIYFPYLVTTVIGTFLAFWLFMFIIFECHFLNLWHLTLDPHTLQNVRYSSSYETLSCFKKLEIVQLGALSFSYMVAGGVSILRFLGHESLWGLITPNEESALQITNRTPEEFFEHYGYYPPGAIPIGNMSTGNDKNNFPSPQSVNRQQSDGPKGTVLLVHSVSDPDVTPSPESKTEDNKIQQSSQNADWVLEEAFAETQSDEEGESEVSGPANDISAPKPPHLADIGPDGHIHWIDELKRYLALSDDTNCEIPEFADAFKPPVADTHSKSHVYGLQKMSQKQHSASAPPLGPDNLSTKEVEDNLRNIFDTDFSKPSSTQGYQLRQRRGAISGPSGTPALDSPTENEVDSGKKSEVLIKPLASAIPPNTIKISTKKDTTNKGFLSVTSGRISFSRKFTINSHRAEPGAYNSILGIFPIGLSSGQNAHQRAECENQSSVSSPLGFSQTGGNIRKSGAGGLSSDGDKNKYANDFLIPMPSWFSQFRAAHQASKTRNLSSNSDECKCQRCQKTDYNQPHHPVGSSSHESISYSLTSDSEDSERTTRHSGNTHQLRDTPELSATGVSSSGTNECVSQKQNNESLFVSSELNAAPVAESVTTHSDEYENQGSQQHCTSESNSTGGQRSQSRKCDGESNCPSDTLVRKIDSDEGEDLKVRRSKEFRVESSDPVSSIISTDGSEDHRLRIRKEANLEPNDSSCAPTSQIVSCDGTNRLGEKKCQPKCRDTHSDLSPSVVVMHPSSTSSSQVVPSDAYHGEAHHRVAEGHQSQSDSTSSSELNVSSQAYVSELLCDENNEEGQQPRRRESRTFAMDLDIIDNSSQTEVTDEGSNDHQEARSRLSSESTDGGLFLDNLFFSDE